MTRDDIIRMAREAGLEGYRTPLDGIERFAALVAAAEREACAQLCEGLPWIIAAIRARGADD